MKYLALKLRFTVRDLFWLALVVALAVCLWLEHSNRNLLARRLDYYQPLTKLYPFPK
jgi:hypothetical protein